MPAVSQFSTAENLAKVNDAITTVERAIQEAQIAVRAGIPSADQVLSNAQDQLSRLQTFRSTYFPTGAA